LPKAASPLKLARRGRVCRPQMDSSRRSRSLREASRRRRAQWEAWFNSGPESLLKAKAKHRNWLSEIEARIANIRAERTGEGRTLTPHMARALAAEWYSWFVAHMAVNKWSKDVLTAYRDRMWEGLSSAAFDDPFDQGEMQRVRPVIADEGKTAQFLSAKRLALDPPSRDLFFDYVARDFFAALDLLTRRAGSDFGKDEYAARFRGRGEGLADPSLTPWSLFEVGCEGRVAVPTIL
jgi:hypothetical protein